MISKKSKRGADYVWLQSPLTVKEHYQYKGQTRTKRTVKDTEQPLSVAAIAKKIDEFFWYKRKVCEGVKGPIEYEFTKRQVVLSKDGLHWKKVWLIIKVSDQLTASTQGEESMS